MSPSDPVSPNQAERACRHKVMEGIPLSPATGASDVHRARIGGVSRSSTSRSRSGRRAMREGELKIILVIPLGTNREPALITAKPGFVRPTPDHVDVPPAR